MQCPANHPALLPAADDEEDQPGGSGGGGADGQEQMLYIPGLGYIPLSNFPGLGGAARAAATPAAPPNPEGERDWSALREMPGATQEGLLNAVAALKEDGRQELTLLVLGKGGVGKSSTINSLLNERVANVTAFQQDVAKPVVYSRHAAGFTLHCIDTPSILEQDNVSDAVSCWCVHLWAADAHVDVFMEMERRGVEAGWQAQGAEEGKPAPAPQRRPDPEQWPRCLHRFPAPCHPAHPPGCCLGLPWRVRCSGWRPLARRCVGGRWMRCSTWTASTATRSTRWTTRCRAAQQLQYNGCGTMLRSCGCSTPAAAHAGHGPDPAAPRCAACPTSRITQMPPALRRLWRASRECWDPASGTMPCWASPAPPSPPPQRGWKFQQHVEQRAEALRSAVAKAGGSVEEMAVALIENSSRCPTNADGEKVVPGEVPWVVDLVEKVGRCRGNSGAFVK